MKFYDIEELPVADRSEQTHSDNVVPFDRGQEVCPDQTADLEALKFGCAWLRHNISHVLGQSYDVWMGVMRILTRVKGGREIAHEIFKKDPRYSAAETDEKFDEALLNMSPPNCAGIRAVDPLSLCADCPVQFTVKSPMAFSWTYPGVSELQGLIVAEAQTQRFHATAYNAVWTFEAFKVLHNHVETGSKGTIVNVLLRDKNTAKVGRARYFAGETRRIITSQEGLTLNTWRAGGIAAEPGETPTILRHFLLLIPIELEREHVLDLIAFHLQNPGRKIAYAPLIIGGQGIGKSFLTALLRVLVGPEHLREIGPDQASTRFRAGWGDCQISVFEELMQGDRLEFYNQLKPWLTQETCPAEEKNIPTRDVTTPRLWLAYSNHADPTRLAADDRRFFVVNSPMRAQPETYYDALWAALESEAAAFKQLLLDRDVSHFKPGAHAPMTDAKRELIETSRPPLELILRQLIDERAYPFHRDVVRREDIRNALASRSSSRPTEGALSSAIKTCGIERLPCQLQMPDGTRPRAWIVRDQDNWRTAPSSAVREELQKTFQGIL